MFEQKLVVGRYINLTSPAVANIPHSDGDFVAQPQHLLTLQQSTTTGGFLNRKKESKVLAGTGAKAHRNFQWLTWLPGAITHVPVGGVDVLTGPMSGCQLVLFNLGGAVQAGHLGTDISSPTATAAVKGAWNVFANAHPGDVIGGFNPLNDWVGALPAAKVGKESSGIKIFGLLTVDAQFYTVVTYPQDTNANLLRIAGVRVIPSATLTTLQNL